MNEKVLKCLFDIKLALAEIDSFFDFRQKSFEIYKSDVILKRAIERNLEIIGEAMGRILKESPEFNIENAKRIIGLRNQIIHGYDAISDEVIWSIVNTYLPILQSEIEHLIHSK